jgi:hypothetical protein
MMIYGLFLSLLISVGSLCLCPPLPEQRKHARALPQIHRQKCKQDTNAYKHMHSYTPAQTWPCQEQQWFWRPCLLAVPRPTYPPARSSCYSHRPVHARARAYVRARVTRGGHLEAGRCLLPGQLWRLLHSYSLCSQHNGPLTIFCVSQSCAHQSRGRPCCPF